MSNSYVILPLMKELSGKEIAGFIKERQAGQVRQLRQAYKIAPKLAIIQNKDDPIIDTYVRVKQRYGADIGIEVEVFHPTSGDIVSKIDELNNNAGVHGIIVQLPIAEPAHTERVLNTVDLAKDVDGLAKDSPYDPATPTAIMWLLSGFNIELKDRKVVIIGRGVLVGAPLFEIMKKSGINVESINRSTDDIGSLTKSADIIVSATGQPNILRSEMIKQGATVIDAGTAVAGGKTVGDLAGDVYERDDLKVTPKRGGVGPLTVSALFDNVIKSAYKTAGVGKD